MPASPLSAPVGVHPAVVSASPAAARSGLVRAAAAGPKPGAGPAPRRRGRAQGPIIILASAAVGLLAVVGVFILGDFRAPVPTQPAAPALPSVAPASASPASGSSSSSTAPAPAAGAASTPSAPAAPAAVSAPAAPVAAATAAATAAGAPVQAVPMADPAPLEPLLDSDARPFDITRRADHPPASSRTAFVGWMLAHTDQKEKFLVQKWALAQDMIRFKSVSHPLVLEAILRTPREYFCRDPRRAYEDAVLPIGWGQTISGPHMVARMTDYLDPQPEQRVLEIGTGSGYQSAVLSELSNHVYTIEIVEPLARETDSIYRKHETGYPEYRNIHRRVADGYYGWPEQAPFDRIIVTCGIDHVPPELLRELAPDGIMVIPIGPPSGQTILRIVKHVSLDGSITLDREDIFQGKKRQIFVPFTSGAGGKGGLHVFEDPREIK